VRGVGQFWRGVRAFPRGIGWLIKNPRYLVLAFLPGAIGLLAFVILGWWFLSNHHFVVSLLGTFESDVWYKKAAVFLFLRLFDIAFFLLSAALSFLIVNIVASPIYDVISVAVERSVRGTATEISFLQSLRLVIEEMKKVAFILMISTPLMFVPGLNILSSLVTAFLLGWEFCDFTLARRGLSFKERFGWAWAEIPAVTGFGIWLIIPFMQLITLPFAVVGGTLLVLESLPE